MCSCYGLTAAAQNILLILLPSSLRLNWNGRNDKTDISQPSASQPTRSGTGDKQGALKICLIESWVSTYCHVEVYTGGIDIKTNGGGIQPCRQHSNGARKQEEDTERCHQQADCHSKTYVEFPAKYHQGHSHSWFVTLVTSTCSPAPAESQGTRGIPENRTIFQLPNHSRSRTESHTAACWIRAEITGDPQQLGISSPTEDCPTPIAEDIVDTKLTASQSTNSKTPTRLMLPSAHRTNIQKMRKIIHLVGLTFVWASASGHHMESVPPAAPLALKEAAADQRPHKWIKQTALQLNVCPCLQVQFRRQVWGN